MDNQNINNNQVPENLTGNSMQPSQNDQLAGSENNPIAPQVQSNVAMNESEVQQPVASYHAETKQSSSVSQTVQNTETMPQIEAGVQNVQNIMVQPSNNVQPQSKIEINDQLNISPNKVENKSLDDTVVNNIPLINDNVDVNNNLNNTNVQSTQTSSFIKPVDQVKKSDDLLNAVPKPDMMISSPADSSISTEALLEDFIQNNSEKIIKRNFNLAALFFNSIYMLYRKMYIEGIILIVISIISFYLSILINTKIFLGYLIANFVIAVVLCFIFNKLYINSCKRKINNIKKKHKTISVSELRTLCKKKGGTSLIIAIIIPIIISIVSTIIFNTLFPIDSEDFSNKLSNLLTIPSSNNKNTKNSNNSNNKDNNNENNENNIDLNNLKYVDTISLNEKVTMDYLAIFKQTNSNLVYKYDYSKVTDETKEKSYCNFSLGVLKDYKDSNKIIKDLSDHYKVKDIKNVSNSNGLKWITFETKENGDKVNYASTNNNGEVYLFKFTTGSEAKELLCRSYYEGMLDSMKFN